MKDEWRFRVTSILDRLLHRLPNVQVLYELAFDVILREIWDNDIWAVSTTGKLLTATGTEAVGDEEVAQETFASAALCS